MDLTITYELVGTGWARCTVTDERGRAEITASYLSDALGRLVLGALGVLAGFESVAFGFDEEPGGYRWLIEATDGDEVQVRLFAVEPGAGPRLAGTRVLFDTLCRPLGFARAVHAAASAVLRDHGEAGYRSKWAEHDFPVRPLHLLTEALALPENEG
jgi:hypothetical protein